jgi:hypothetical protein
MARQSPRETLNNDIREIAAQFHVQVVDTSSLKSVGPLTIDRVHLTEDGKQYPERILAAPRTQICSSNFLLPQSRSEQIRQATVVTL